jgi:hypothetical protein
MVQERSQFGAESKKEENKGNSDKQLRTFATKFMIVKDAPDQEFRDNLKKLTFRLCYFSQCPRTGLGANRMPLVITYARKLQKYVRCSCRVGALCADGRRDPVIQKDAFDPQKGNKADTTKDLKTEN